MRTDAVELGRRGPASEPERAHLARAGEVLPGGEMGGSTIPEDVRFVTTSAKGPFLFDESGNRYVDYVIGAGAMILGHAHPAVEAAVIEQVRRGTHYFAILNGPMIDLAGLLAEAIPCAGRINFTTSGSEATFYCMRFARAFTGRDKVLKFEGSYHGNHDVSLFSSTPKHQSNYPVGQPDTGGIPGNMTDNVLVAPYNDLAAARAIVEANRAELAAIIVEPVQRIVAPQPGFLQGLRKIADDNGVLLIFDEVVTGFRLAYGGAQEYFEVTPDLAAYGKVMGGGIGLGCVAGRADIVDLSAAAMKGDPRSAYMNGTMHGNPLGSAAGLATLKTLQADPDFYKRLNAFSDELRGALSERLARHGVPAVIVGIGSLWHVLFTGRQPVNHADVMAADAARGRAFDTALIREGIFVIPGTRRLVSAAHGPDEMEATVAAFDRVCRQFA